MRLKYFLLVSLTLFLPGIRGAYAQVTFTSSNLPIVIIDTNGGIIVDEPKITAHMGIIDHGTGIRNYVTDPFNNYDGNIGIEIRGSTSQAFFPKKQYGVELRDGTGKSIDAPLLGLPKKDDWVLFAPYNDKSLMRDVLAYKLGRDLGRYASRSKYCEVVINGQYMGVYVLLEKVKRDKNRVSIDKLDPVEISGDNLTGGYIIKLDKTTGNGGDGWTSPYPPLGRTYTQTTYFQYEYPKQEDIVPEQKTYIRSYVTAFENTLSGPNFRDPVEGYAKYIDVDAFIDFFIANEVTRNPDAYRLSTFIHKKKDSDGGKLAMGPIWDFNLGFGNVNYCIEEKPQGFVTDYNSICPDDGWLVPFWWSRLFQDTTFGSRVTDRWIALRQGPYQTSKIMDYIDSVATVLNVESQQRNFAMWPVLGQWVWPNTYVGQTFQQEVNWLKDWLTQRLIWLDNNIPGLITGIESADNTLFEVTFSPNPSSAQVLMHYKIKQPGSLYVEVIDLSGKQLSSFEKNHLDTGEFDVDPGVSVLPPGMYITKVRYGGETKIIKLIRY